MKKQYIVLGILLSMTSGLIAITDADAKKQGADILGNMVSGHNRAFGVDNIYKTTLDLNMWNNAISRMKTFVTTIINENKNFLGMRDSTLTDALDKITKAEIDLVNNIKITRGVLQVPATLQQQIAILNQIASDMIKVQSSLGSSMSSVAKDEARLLLMKTAMFIETTAKKAAKDAKPPLPPRKNS